MLDESGVNEFDIYTDSSENKPSNPSSKPCATVSKSGWYECSATTGNYTHLIANPYKNCHIREIYAFKENLLALPSD